MLRQVHFYMTGGNQTFAAGANWRGLRCKEQTLAVPDHFGLLLAPLAQCSLQSFAQGLCQKTI